MIAGTNNVKLGSFTLSAGSTEGINVNTIVVNLSSANAASVTDLMLKDASGGAQIGTTKASPSTDNSFSANVSIPASGTKTIDIYGSIKSGAEAGSWVATIDSTTGGTGATTANSATVGSDVTLQTITVGSGTITVAVNDGSTPNSYNAVAGSSEVKVGTFRFTAQYSPFTVQELKVKVPTDAATSVSAVILKWSGGSASGALTLPSVAGETHATSTFTGLSFQIPENTSKDLDVYVSIPTIASGASTGKAISVLIDANEGFKAVETERLEIFRRQVLLEGLRARPEQAYDIWRGGLHPRPAMFQAWFRILTVLMAVVSPSLYLALYDFYAENPWRRIGSIFNRKQ
jgi:hypothetical protein